MSRAGWAVPAGVVTGVLAAEVCFLQQWALWAALAVLWFAFTQLRVAWAGAALLGFLWATLILQSHLADRLHTSPSGLRRTVQGQIQGLPEVHADYTRFRFRLVGNARPPVLPARLLAYWYRDPPPLLPGEVWQLDVQLKPPFGRLNFHGPDREMWLFAEGIGGLATVRAGRRLGAAQPYLQGLQLLRHRIRAHIDDAVGNEPARSIVAALAIADRSNLPGSVRQSLARTGTSHLLAISGLHVGLAALCGVWLARLLLALVPLRCLAGLGYALTLVGGLLSASLYAALAGFGISTLRALLMLAVGMLALLSRRRVHAGRGILLALAVLLVCDPLAVFSPGFWLSFAAVAVLLSMFRGGSRGQAPGWRQLPQAQFGVMLALLPMSAWWFQSASLVGLAANLLAIPWISLVVVPLVLLGMMLMPLGSMASALVLSVAGSAAGMLASVLDWLAGLPTASLFLPQPSPATVLVATLGALMLLLLPRGIRHRWLGGVLLLPLFATPQAPAEGAIRMELLDVGQGTAVLVQSHRHLLLYDSGPGDGGEFNLVDPVIRPAVRASGHHAPERILISHTDLDHSGGLHALRDVYPATAIYASLRQRPAGIAPCNDQLHWAWDGFSFQVLHPSPYLPYIGNDSSCVLRVRGGGVTILLPGDISAAVESRLLRDYPGELTVLMAPHHGSRTGSSKAYLRGTKPAMAVAAAGLGNRFGFPHGEIRRRYREAGVPLWSTDACGALRLTLTPTGTTEAFSARRLRPAPWRWPADPSCP